MSGWLSRAPGSYIYSYISINNKENVFSLIFPAKSQGRIWLPQLQSHTCQQLNQPLLVARGTWNLKPYALSGRRLVSSGKSMCCYQKRDGCWGSKHKGCSLHGCFPARMSSRITFWSGRLGLRFCISNSSCMMMMLVLMLVTLRVARHSVTFLKSLQATLPQGFCSLHHTERSWAM